MAAAILLASQDQRPLIVFEAPLAAGPHPRAENQRLSVS